jgi:intein/homing endonuclease
MPYYNYTPKEYKELTEELFEMMTVGQKFYKLTKSGKTKLVKLSRIQYRHGLHKENKVYNLDVSTNHTFFTNGILGHNAISPSISKLGSTSGGIV